MRSTRPQRSQRNGKASSQESARHRTTRFNMVNWYDAVLFCNWLSRKEGRTACYERTGKKEKVKLGNAEYERDVWRLVADATGYRLPTEAEWEYSCCAGTTTGYASGSDEEMLRKYAVINTSRTASCGSKLPNGWGLFDMHGNIREWCWDAYEKYDVKSPVVDPTGAARVPDRVIRGGSWVYTADGARASARYGYRRSPGTSSMVFAWPEASEGERVT